MVWRLESALAASAVSVTVTNFGWPKGPVMRFARLRQRRSSPRTWLVLPTPKRNVIGVSFVKLQTGVVVATLIHH